MIDPNEFVITRKRKKYKFAKFSNAKNCFEFKEWNKQATDVVEIGAGTGLFSVELASRHPEESFVAIDVKADRLQKGAYEALERNLTNISFVRARADQIIELFPANSVQTIWLTFADPFPKKRSAGRRMTHPIYLRKYKELLKSNGTIIIKHDNPDFFNWSLEQLVGEKWQIESLTFDLHESELDADYKIMTTYEQRWLNEGRITKLVQATVQ
jgi:tRNA (guanine-N7-)-methyltransferase